MYIFALCEKRTCSIILLAALYVASSSMTNCVVVYEFSSECNCHLKVHHGVANKVDSHPRETPVPTTDKRTDEKRRPSLKTKEKCSIETVARLFDTPLRIVNRQEHIARVQYKCFHEIS